MRQVIEGHNYNSNNMYEVLMLDNDASQQDIRKAYRSLSKHYQPLLQGSAEEDQDEYKLFNDITKKIIVAYKTLSDLDSKTVHDDQLNNRKNKPDADVFQTKTNKDNPLAKDGLPVYIDRNISFADSLKASKMLIKYSVKEYCTSCLAKGEIIPDGVVTCPTCNGERTIKKVNTNFLGHKVEQVLVCPDCKGKPSSAVKCVDCNGKGYNDIRREEQIDIPAGLTTGYREPYKGLGNPGFLGGEDGDLIVSLTVIEDDNYKQVGDNIEGTLELKLSELLEGGKRVINTPRGRVRITIPPNCVPGHKLTVAKAGMPVLGQDRFGELILYITLHVPMDLTEEQIQELTRLNL